MKRNILLKVISGLVLVAVLVGLGAFAFRAGLAQGLAANGQFEGSQNWAPGSRFAMPYHYFAMPYGGMRPFGGHSFVGGLFGFLGLLFLGFLVIAAIRGLFWGRARHFYGMHGGWGMPMAGQTDWDKGVPPMFNEWHRRAHAAEAVGDAPQPDVPEKPVE